MIGDSMLVQGLISSIAYLVGAIPTGYLIARYQGIEDIRVHGSGGTGATNVARVLGAPFFIVVLLMDALKAAGYLLVLRFMGFPLQVMYLSAVLLVVGNCYPVFLQLRGGKGFATTIGCLAVIHPLLLGITLCIWFGIFLVTQVVGIASAIAMILLPLCGTMLFPLDSSALLLLSALALLVVVRHHDHLIRLIR